MKSISILGVFVADLCFIGDKIPSKGQTILGKKHVVGPGGKGSNQAIAASRLNGEVSFITKVGKDSHSEMAFNLYKEAGLKTHSIIQDEKLFTGVAGIMIDKDGNNAINVVSGAAEHLFAEDIDNKVETIKNSEIFLTQMETPDEITIYALKKAKEWQKKKAEAGLAAILWPKEFGGYGGTPIEQVIYQQEEHSYFVHSGYFEIGIGMLGPTMMVWGKDEDKKRYLPKMLNGEEIWCQLFSEPSAGSDLAGIRMKAEKDGSDWILNGQKVWTSGAHFADYGMIVARSDPSLSLIHI